MRVTIDPTIPPLTDEEREEMRLRSDEIPCIEDDPEGFRKSLEGVREVRMSPEVAAQLEAIGMTPDEVVAALLKAGKLQQ